MTHPHDQAPAPLTAEVVAMVAQLRTRLVMSMFASRSDLYTAQERQRTEAADMLTTLAAENATLRAEQDEGVRLLENARQIERNVQSVREHEHKRAEAALAELATLRASEAAALERVTRIEKAVRNIDANLTHFLDRKPQQMMVPETVDFLRSMVRAALTPTADKE